MFVSRVTGSKVVAPGKLKMTITFAIVWLAVYCFSYFIIILAFKNTHVHAENDTVCSGGVGLCQSPPSDDCNMFHAWSMVTRSVFCV